MAITKKQARRAAALTVATAAAVTLANPFAGAAEAESAAAGIASAGEVNGLTAPSSTKQVAVSASAQSELAKHGIVADGSSPAATIMGTDPYRQVQWGYDAIQAPAANTASTGANVIVGVVDSGVAKIDDLAGRVMTGNDFIASGNGTNDQNGHGTGVASIIGATTGNSVGMAGIAPAVKILPVRVCDANGSCPVDAVAAGITWAVDHGAQVINASLGGSSTDALTAAVAYAESKGVPIAASVGNSAENGNPVLYPGGYDTVVGVTAVDSAKARASFAEYGKQVDIAAPGVKILQASPTGFVYASGTSQASPHVAGVMALAKAYKPAITTTQMRSVLTSTATDLGASGRDDQFGAGLVHAGAVLTALGATVTTPNATATPVTAVPVTSTATPSSGTSAGGATVTITGGNFGTLDVTNAATVTFGGVNAAGFQVLSNTKLTAVTPAGVNGPVAVAVTNAAGTSTGKLTYTYRAPLGAEFDAVTSKVTGGTAVPVTVTGGTVGDTQAAFAAEKVTAKVGEVNATIAWVDSTHVKVTTPATTKAAAVPITLYHDGVAGTPSSSTVSYAPSATTVIPAKISTAGGTTVTISGTGFLGVDTSDSSAVTFGGVDATSFEVKSATQIVAVAPAGTNGTAPVVVTTSGGTSTVNITYRAPLGITVTDSTAVKASGGTVVVEVTGATVGTTQKEFAAEAITASFGNSKIVPTWVDSTHVKLALPASTAASVAVTLNHDGVAGVPATIAYAPVVVSLSATSDTTAGGKKVTVRIAGGDVSAATAFTFGDGDATCTAVGKGVATSWACTVPAAAQSGPTWVSFTASNGTVSRYTAAATFSYSDLDS
ncbi:S8 family serine peptidase [Actinoplanes sp. NPDC051851]|uniref:S8 family serine peptidase n=1 Tax=Actinoplanes sp. NPDC051851 TaxID=3154753 RepID=UPI0034183AAB